MLAAQLGIAQEGPAVATGGVGWITEKDEALRRRFVQLLLHVRTRDLVAGWQLAADVGRPAVPVLWKLFEAEPSDVNHRLVLLAGAMLAGGPLEDERLLRWLGQQEPMLRERTLAAMVVALGPTRPRPVANFWPRFLGGAKTREDVLAIAVRLACVRFPGTDEGAPVLVDDDPGLAAATAYAGLSVPPSVAAKLWDLGAREQHADLFWRGELLGAARGGKPPPELLERARKLMRMPGEEMAPARDAATWLRAVGADLRADGSNVDVQWLRIAAGHPGAAEQLRNLLQPQARPRDEEPQRLAVAYALAQPPAVVIDQRDQWSADPRIARHVAVALAWRFAGRSSAAAPVEVAMPGLPEWSFVRAASGATVERDAVCDDPRLQAALQLLADGRLEPAALQDLLEETLWRWGSHPRIAAWQLERLLVRDLLLAGSNTGGAKYQPAVRPDLRYSPSGMDRNDSFFPVAVDLFDFLWRPRAPMPAEFRLPR